MNAKSLFWWSVGISAGALAYGALVESNRLVLVRRELDLEGWPERLDGFRIALLGDFHLRDRYSFALAQRAISTALDQDPDMVALVGDFVARWRPEVVEMLGDTLEPLLLMQGNVVAIPGNHEYLGGEPDALAEICAELNIKLLRNESWIHQGIQWVGVDSANAKMADPVLAFDGVKPDFPTVVLWHEPDVVDWLPERAQLMLSGHSHGGQFLTPWGQPFIGSKNGVRYRRGFFTEPATPLYVTSGVGTTGPPSRLFCPPEVVILTLRSA